MLQALLEKVMSNAGNMGIRNTCQKLPNRKFDFASVGGFLLLSRQQSHFFSVKIVRIHVDSEAAAVKRYSMSAPLRDGSPM